MLLVFLTAGCPEPERLGDSAVTSAERSDTGDSGAAPLLVPDVADHATGALLLDSGVYLVSTISDRNGDGLTDLLLSDGAVVPVPLANASQADVVIQQYAGAGSSYPNQNLWTARDLDGDGVSELVAWYTGSGYLAVAVYQASTAGLSSGEAVWDEAFAENHGNYTYPYVVDDVSGDTLSDVQFVHLTTDLLRDRTVLQPPSREEPEWRRETLTLEYYPEFYEAQFVGLDDIDGDGLRDVAEVDFGTLWIWSGSAMSERADSTPLAVLTPETDGGSVSTPHSGDFDGDGRAEVVCNARSGVRILTGVDHDGSVEDATVATLSHHDYPYAGYSRADADADGRTDLAVYGDTEIGVFLAPAAGALTEDDALARWQVHDGDYAWWVGDQNGDGMAELVVPHDGLLLTLTP